MYVKMKHFVRFSAIIIILLIIIASPKPFQVAVSFADSESNESQETQHEETWPTETNAPTNIGFRTEDPGPFLHWPLPSTIPVNRISRLPDSPWTHNFLGISNCPPYPALVNNGPWQKKFYLGEFENYALPGTTRERVKWHNTDNRFACYGDGVNSLGEPSATHAGTDITANNGTAVYAAAAGRVHAVQAVNPCITGAPSEYRIIIRHDNVNGTGATWYTIYLHVRNPQVFGGQEVSPSTYIANVGCGHLHFETSRGTTGYHNNRNHWGIDQSPWTGCLWMNQSLCPIAVSPPNGYIDAPAPNSWRQGTVRINGWAKVEGASINRVEIWIDGVHRANATYGTSRPDVGGNFGYYWDWNTAQYADGNHNIQVKAVANNGTSSWLIVSNTSNNTTLPVRTDNRPPSNPTSVSPGCTAANNVWQNSCNDPNFTWSGASDGNGIGVKDYQYYWGTSPTGAPTTYTTNNGFNPPAVPGAVAIYYLRVAARDQLNQQNPTPSTLFVLRYDSSPPNVTLQINNGATTANQVNVMLNLTASDTGSGVDRVRISNNNVDWSNWLPYQNTLPWTLFPLNGQEQTIYVQVRDKAHNVSSTASASITLDLYSVMPHSDNYRICANVINIGGQADIQSGSYQLTSSIGEPGTSHSQSANYQAQSGFLSDLTHCLPIEPPTGTGYQITEWVIGSGGSLRSSANYILGDTLGEAFTSAQNELSSTNYRLTIGFWANLDAGVAPPPTVPPTPTPGPTPIPSPTPPPGPTPTPVPGGFGVTINEGSLYTNSPDVIVHVSAPNVTQMRLSNDGGYGGDGWTVYQPTTSWTISTLGNYVLPRLVYVWFRDAEGIVYGAYMDDIIYDPVAPEGSITLLGEEETGGTALYLFAIDDNSGVVEMRLSEDPTLAEAEWQPYEEFIAWQWGGNDVYVQYRDAAGNVSEIYSTAGEPMDIPTIYLPIVVR